MKCKYNILFCLVLVFSVNAWDNELYQSEELANCDTLYLKNDYKKAMNYCESAIKQGYALAMTNYAYIIVKNDSNRAVDLLQKASDLGNARAMSNLGIYYFYGTHGISQDEKLGLKLIKSAAKLGNGSAKLALARIYSEKDKNFKKESIQLAMQEYYKGNPNAAEILSKPGLFIETSVSYSPSVYTFLMRASKMGGAVKNCNGLSTSDYHNFALRNCPQYLRSTNDADGYLSLGSYLRFNIDRKLNKEEGLKFEAFMDKIKLFPKRVQNRIFYYPDSYEFERYYPAYVNLDFFNNSELTNGVTNIEESDALKLYKYAVKLYDKGLLSTNDENISLKEYYALIQFNIAEIYDNKSDFTSNMVKSISWYKKAASTGSVDAIERLGEIYEIGLGVKKDQKQAINYYLKAISLREKDARWGGTKAELQMSKYYAQGKGVEKDKTKAAKLLRSYTNINDDCVIKTEDDLVCVKPNYDHIFETNLLLSGLWGKEFKKIGVLKLKELMKYHSSGDLNGVRGEIIQAYNHISTGESLKSLISKGISDDGIKHLNGGSKIPPILSKYSPKASDWEKWKVENNKLYDEVWPDFDEPVIGEISLLPKAKVNKHLTPQNIKWRLPIKTIVISKPNQSKNDWQSNRKKKFIKYTQKRLLATNSIFKTCDIEIEPQDIVVIEAELLGPIDKPYWDTGDEKTSTKYMIDWRWNMPALANPVVIFHEYDGLVDPLDEDIKGRRYGLAELNDPRYPTGFFGSKYPTLLYGNLKVPGVNENSTQIVAHEIGHLLGLPHSYHFNPSLMSYAYGVDANNKSDLLFENSILGFSEEECKDLRRSPYLKKVTH